MSIPATAFTRRAAYNLTFGVIAAALVFVCGFPLSHATARQASESGLTAHEWGTFTSVSNSEGRSIHWLPLSGSTDLPSFVERLGDVNFKGGLLGTMRMETPVIYFYSPRATTVSVRATFSKGLITEWFPHASVPALDPRKDITFSLKLLMAASPGILSMSLQAAPSISPRTLPKTTTMRRARLPQLLSQPTHLTARSTNASCSIAV